MLPLCTEEPAMRKQMMTIDIDTISGVPLTGELNTTRPITSAQTRKPSRKMITAAHTSRARTVQAFMFLSKGISRARWGGKRQATDHAAARRTSELLDFIAHRPFVLIVLGGLQGGFH